MAVDYNYFLLPFRNHGNFKRHHTFIEILNFAAALLKKMEYEHKETF